jgi:hypothetical protein
MEVKNLKTLAYKAYVNGYGLHHWEIRKENKYYYMETDGTLTDLGECQYHHSDSGHGYQCDGSWWEQEIKFENTNDKRYHIRRGGSGCGGCDRLPIIEQK